MSFDDDFDEPFENFEPPLQWGTLIELCSANTDYFASHQDEKSIRIKAALLVILDHLDQLQPLYKEIAEFAPQFDYDEETPANGYRSFLLLIDKCILYCTTVCQEIYNQKNSMLFRKSYHMREIEACSQLLASLYTCLQRLKMLYTWNTEVAADGKPSLFSVHAHSQQELLNHVESINQYCFYGRCLGFQFCDSLKNILKILLFCMASFSEMHYNNGTLLGRCTNSVKYLMDPEVRARRIVNIIRHADISFCKSFWFLNESNILPDMPFMTRSSIAINQLISIPPEELILPTLDGGTISIPIPNSHIGKKPIHVRLFSSKRRLGMVGSGGVGGELLGPCEELIIHSHGGGFISQTSRTHEAYLQNWAAILDIPILSIDYSLAPEAPYPRAVEEILYAYAWALNHASTLLGSTAQKVIFVGDSAGGSLNMAVCLKCIELNIRKPDGILMVYAPLVVELVLSPSRLLCITDPLLPFGFVIRCLKAYVVGDDKKITKENENEECAKSDTESFAEVSESDLIALALSPNGDDGANGVQKLVSLPSDSTLNSVSLTEVDGGECPKVQAKSQKYINKFLNIYRNAGTTSSTPAENGSISRDGNISGSDKSWSLFGWSFRGRSKEIREFDMENSKSPLEEYIFTTPNNPFLSPYFASDNILARIPPITLLTVQLDPCIDDSVMFARKLRSLGNKVTLDVLPDLPHGFLNLCSLSKEAQEGMNLCAKRMRELLEL